MPGFDILEFRSQLDDTGILQTNKYEVIITPPPGLTGSSITSVTGTANGGESTSFLDFTRDLSYRCIGATLPGVTLRTSDVNRFGTGILEKMPFSGAYTDIDLTFLCDRYGEVYNFWYGWLNYIFSVTGEEQSTGPVSQITPGRKFYTTEYKDNYSTNIMIMVYDNSGEASIVYTLYKAFPISINDTPLSWSDNNNTIKLSTRISFREWSLNESALVGPLL
jgi:hypothetical protein